MKELKIVKRGRKYFTCEVPGRSYRVKLIINDRSTNLQEGFTGAFFCVDHSIESRHGTTVILEPLIIRDDRAQILSYLEKRKWLGYALDDAKQGLSSTNAIRKVLQEVDVVEDPELEEDLSLLKRRLEENKRKREEAFRIVRISPDAEVELNKEYATPSTPSYSVKVRAIHPEVLEGSCGEKFRLVSLEIIREIKELEGLNIPELAGCIDHLPRLSLT